MIRDQFYLVDDFGLDLKAHDALKTSGLIQIDEQKQTFSIDDDEIKRIVEDLVRARFDLANRLFTFIRNLDPTEEVDARQIVSRGYYAMFHASRSCCLAVDRNDITGFSNQCHAKLPDKMHQLDPTPNLSPSLRDTLRAWRALRNTADYDIYILPFPAMRSKDVFTNAKSAARQIEAFLVKCVTILRQRGGVHVVIA